ncbi:Protein MAIN-LIKE 2 [Glycine soja]
MRRQRPTASARRKQQQERVLEDLLATGFPGGPHDTLVLRDCENHIAPRIWNGKEHPKLKLSSHGRKMAKFGRSTLEIEGLVVASGLSPLITCSLNTGDRRLMYAFMEHWYKETRSFHLPIEEVTITLDDVTGIPQLRAVSCQRRYQYVGGITQSHAAEARVETIQYHDSYVRLSWLRDVYQMKIEVCHWIVAALAYLLHLLGCILFANKSATHVHVTFLDALRDLTLVKMLQFFSLEFNITCCHHFLSVGSAVPAKDYDERRPRACRWTSGKALPISTYRRRLNKLTHDVVCWIPYGDHRSFREFEVISLFSGHLRWGPLMVIHRSKKVVRQFGYIQTILPYSVASSLSIEEIDDRWMQFND